MSFFAWAAGVAALGGSVVMFVLAILLVAFHPWLLLVPVVWAAIVMIGLRRKHAQDRAKLALSAATSDVYAERLVAERAAYAADLHEARVAGNPIAHHSHTSLDELDEIEAEAVHRVRMLPRRTGRRHARFWEGTDWD